MARSRTRLAIPLGHTWNDCLQEHPALTGSLERLPKPTFVRAWRAIAYLYPGLHPDGYASADSGWPRVLRRFAAEAWRRADAGELADEELYACDAQWSGLYAWPNRDVQIAAQQVSTREWWENRRSQNSSQ